MAGDIDTTAFSHVCNCSMTTGSCTCFQWNQGQTFPSTSTWTYTTDPFVLEKLHELEAKLDHLLQLFEEL